MSESSSFAARCRRALHAFRAPSADGLERAAPASFVTEAVDGLASVDLARRLMALDPRYLSTELVPDP